MVYTDGGRGPIKGVDQYQRINVGLLNVVKKQLAGQFVKEVIENYVYYHKANVGNAAAGLTTPFQTSFFSVNIGTATNRELDTNWTGQPQIVDGQTLIRIKGFAFGLPCTVIRADANGILNDDTMELKIGDKVYLRAAVVDLGCHGGINGQDNTMAAGTAVLTNGVPHNDNYHRIGSYDNPIILPPQQRFEVNAFSAYTTAVRCRMVMIVDEFRTA